MADDINKRPEFMSTEQFEKSQLIEDRLRAKSGATTLDMLGNQARIASIPPYARPSTGQRPQADSITGMFDRMGNQARIANIPPYAQPSMGGTAIPPGAGPASIPPYAQPSSGLPQQDGSQFPSTQVGPNGIPQYAQPSSGLPQQVVPPMLPNTQAPANFVPGTAMQTTQLPLGGTATAPVGVAEGVENLRDPSLPPAVDARGYTPEEARRVDQELKIAGAKQGIAGRAIVDSLRKQGMKDEDIKVAIGADQNPNMSRSQAVTKLKELQRKQQMQGASSRSAKDTEKIMGMDNPDAERFRGLEDAWAGTGGDPLGKPLESYMTDSNRKEFDRLRNKVANKRAREGDFTRMENLLKQATVKSGRETVKREATDKQLKEKGQRDNVESLIKSREDRKTYQSEKAQQDTLKNKYKEAIKYDPKKEKQATIDAETAYDNFKFSFEGDGTPTAQAPTKGATLTPELAKQFLDAAGGNRQQSEENARKAGYTW